MKIDVYVLGEYKGNAIFNETGIYTTFIIDEYQLTLDSKKQRISIDHLRDTYCSFCYHKRIHIKDKLWLCPGMEGSPMHGFGPKPIAKSLDEILKSKGCTIEEYRTTRDNHPLYPHFNTNES